MIRTVRAVQELEANMGDAVAVQPWKDGLLVETVGIHRRDAVKAILESNEIDVIESKRAGKVHGRGRWVLRGVSNE